MPRLEILGSLLAGGLAPRVEVQKGSVCEASPILGLSSHFCNHEIMPVSLGIEPESALSRTLFMQGHIPACFSLLNYPRNTGIGCFCHLEKRQPVLHFLLVLIHTSCSPVQYLQKARTNCPLPSTTALLACHLSAWPDNLPTSDLSHLLLGARCLNAGKI